MWLIDGTPALFTDLYELTMAQAYFEKGMDETAYFEVFIRHLPEHWGFFVMAGLPEVESYLREFRFAQEDIAYLRSTGMFADDFLEYLGLLDLNVKVRTLPEGTVFFPNEPIMEVSGPILHAQLLETYLLNILGFSVIEATLAARIILAAGTRGEGILPLFPCGEGVPPSISPPSEHLGLRSNEARACPELADGMASQHKGETPSPRNTQSSDTPIPSVVDFGLRRCQGPISSIRAARGGQMAGFAATSNVFAARLLGLPPSGTMAHSFIEAHDSEEQAFRDFAQIYREKAILLVDTYDSIEGIRTAARVAKDFATEGIRIRGIRLDSGDLAELSRFAREHFRKEGLEFLRIFASGDLDEFRIADLLAAGAEIDGFGVGTRFAASQHAPAVGIVYKIAQYGDRPLYKSSPEKATRPGRKTVTRVGGGVYEKDVVLPLRADADDLLQPFQSSEPMSVIRQRLASELARLPESIKAVRNANRYPVAFA